jgi:hypothetical protein
MGLALTASALMALSTTEQRSARQSLGRLHTEYALDNAQNAAVLEVFETGKAARLQWRLSIDDGEFDALAEPEAAKLSLAAAATLDDKSLLELGVSDAAALRRRLSVAEDAETPVEDLDASGLWRACAPSLISHFGQAKDLALKAPGPPGQLAFDWRLGEVWRIRITDKDGWADERLVRFVGDAMRPAAVIQRHLHHQHGDTRCQIKLGS